MYPNYECSFSQLKVLLRRCLREFVPESQRSVGIFDDLLSEHILKEKRGLEYNDYYLLLWLISVHPFAIKFHGGAMNAFVSG